MGSVFLINELEIIAFPSLIAELKRIRKAVLHNFFIEVYLLYIRNNAYKKSYIEIASATPPK